jgi:hypothetical protein
VNQNPEAVRFEDRGLTESWPEGIVISCDIRAGGVGGDELRGYGSVIHPYPSSPGSQGCRAALPLLGPILGHRLPGRGAAQAVCGSLDGGDSCTRRQPGGRVGQNPDLFLPVRHPLLSLTVWKVSERGVLLAALPLALIATVSVGGLGHSKVYCGGQKWGSSDVWD